MKEETGCAISFSGIGNAMVGKAGKDCLWEEAVETAATSGCVVGMRSIKRSRTLCLVRCITGQSMDGKIN